MSTLYGELKNRIEAGHLVPTTQIERRRYWNQIIINMISELISTGDSGPTGCASDEVIHFITCVSYADNSIYRDLPLGHIGCFKCEICRIIYNDPSQGFII